LVSEPYVQSSPANEEVVKKTAANDSTEKQKHFFMVGVFNCQTILSTKINKNNFQEQTDVKNTGKKRKRMICVDSVSSSR